MPSFRPIACSRHRPCCSQSPVEYIRRRSKLKILRFIPYYTPHNIALLLPSIALLPLRPPTTGLATPLLSDPSPASKFFGPSKNGLLQKTVPFGAVSYVRENTARCQLHAELDSGHVLEFTISSERARENLLSHLTREARAERSLGGSPHGSEKYFRFPPQDPCTEPGHHNVLPESSVPGLLLLIGKPVECLLESSMHWCDPKREDKKSKWLPAFCISMVGRG